MTTNDPDEHGGAPDTGPPARDDETAAWVPPPRLPAAPPEHNPRQPWTGAPPGPPFDDSPWPQPAGLPDPPAPGYFPRIESNPQEAGFSPPPPGPSPDPDGWDSSPAPPLVPQPPQWPDPYHTTPVPAGDRPPGPALSIGGWRADEPTLVQPQPQYGAPPPGPDVSLDGWAQGQRTGSGDATMGPWSGYREGWLRRLLGRLRGRRPHG